MEKAILPGDRVWIWKWGFGLERDGIYLFNNIQIDSSGNENLFLKRLVGLPGDTVLYVNDLIWINNTPHHTSWQEIRRFNVGVNQMPLASSFFENFGIEDYKIKRTDKPWLYQMDVPENKIQLLRMHPYITHLWRDDHKDINPLYYKLTNKFFNKDSLARYIIPKSNEPVILYESVWPTYRPLLNKYEKISMDSILKLDKIIIEKKDTMVVNFKRDYVFFAGDNLPHSDDSRHWGLIPADDIYGKAGFILYSQELYRDPFPIRWNRTFLEL